ncbi:MAG TPA: hypothetical protein VHC20_02415 [Candidatus Paceibacterota bacterium]|nr:hypothetical protein [Candidatus Paceibacterota bacterium]
MEYGLIAALIGVVIIGAVTAFQGGFSDPAPQPAATHSQP